MFGNETCVYCECARAYAGIRGYTLMGHHVRVNAVGYELVLAAYGIGS